MLPLRIMLSLTGMERPMRPLAKSCEETLLIAPRIVRIGHHGFQVRAEARPSRMDEARAMDVVKVHRAKAVARSEPGVENVTRTQRQPPNRAKTEAKPPKPRPPKPKNET